MLAEGVTVGETSTLYYDRSKSALPSTSKLVFKAGLNRWESIQLVDMVRAEGFQQSGGSASEWWSVDFTLSQVGTLDAGSLWIWQMCLLPCLSVVVSLWSGRYLCKSDCDTDLHGIKVSNIWFGCAFEACALPCRRLLLQETFKSNPGILLQPFMFTTRVLSLVIHFLLSTCSGGHSPESNSRVLNPSCCS